jgi:hypothetical protein
MAARQKTTGNPKNEGTTYRGRNYTVLFNEMTEPGAYYFHPTGWLYRVPDESLAAGHSPLISINSKDECFVTKISDDPWIPINKARQLCSDRDYMVNF